MMTPFIAEIVGTFILILLGQGVVANVNLKDTTVSTLLFFSILINFRILLINKKNEVLLRLTLRLNTSESFSGFGHA